MLDKAYFLETTEISAVVRVLSKYQPFKDFGLSIQSNEFWRFEAKHENGFSALHGMNFVYVQKKGVYKVHISGVKFDGFTNIKVFKSLDEVVRHLTNEVFDAINADRKRGF